MFKPPQNPPRRIPQEINSQMLVRSRMPELDTLRGVASVAVVLYHLFYWARDMSPFTPVQRRFYSLFAPGQFGVNLFFVLSGFLITGILLDSKNRADYYDRFYYRRALRILPAYYFTLCLVAIFALSSRGFLLMSAIYCPNLSGLFGIALSYPVLWSLGVEEHFYFLWPVAAQTLKKSYLLWLSIAILMVSPVSRYLAHVHAMRVPGNGEYGYYTWNNMDGLALGALIAQLLRKPNWGTREAGKLAGAMLLLAVLMTAVGYPGILTRRTAIGEALQEVPWNLACGALLCVFLILGISRWKNLLIPRPLTFFGRISYGLYLYHLLFFYLYAWAFRRLALGTVLPAGQWAQTWWRALFVGATAVCFSYLSREYLEEFFLKLKDTPPKVLIPGNSFFRRSGVDLTENSGAEFEQSTLHDSAVKSEQHRPSE